MSVIEHGIEIAALVLLPIAGRALFLHFWPYRPCRWCRPGGVLGGSVVARMAGHEAERRRGGCWRCRNTKVTRRWGAYHVHKVKLSLIQAWDERGLD